MNDPRALIPTSFAKRLTQAVNYGLSGGWFTPENPPYATQPQTAGRRFDYLAGYNISTRPRRDSGIDFQTLRNFAYYYDILRLLIERRKDQIATFEWSVVPSDEALDAGEDTEDLNERAAAATKFLKYPDGRNTWNTWLRGVLEDMLVLDAVALWPVFKGKQLLRLETIDPSSIKIVIDESGRRPEPPYPAYQQVLHGIPTANFLKDELFYYISNPASNRIYGLSKVEQALITINIGMNRESSQLKYFTDGNVPAALVGVPDNWPAATIAQFQASFDAMLQGDLAARRKLWFVPGEAAKNIKEFKSEEALLKTPFDEWIIRILCFNLGISPTPFVNQVNRACYSVDTETLTDKGWRKFDEIGPDEKIATVNPETLGLEFHNPVGLHVYPYEGEMVHFLTKGVDVLVTPDHDMWFANPRNGAYRKAHAEDLPSYQLDFQASVKSYTAEEKNKFILPRVFLWEGSAREELLYEVSIPMDDWLEFLGYFLSEGGLSSTNNHYLLTLAQNSGETCDKIQACLDRLPFKYTRYPQSSTDPCQRWNVYGKQLCEWLRDNTGSRCNDKKIPRESLGLSQRQLRILFDAMMAGDGTWDKREGRTAGAYHTTSKQLADDFQELAFKLGWDTRCSLHYEAHGERNAAWRVHLCKRPRDAHSVNIEVDDNLKYQARRREPYEGIVYCFEVPNHLFVTRRNGKIGIHGNTAFSAAEEARDEGLGPTLMFLKDMMDDIINKCLRLEGIEFKWDEEPDNDPISQATIDDMQLRNALRSIDEIRQRDGLDTIGIGPMIYTPQGAIPLSMFKDGTAPGLQPPPASTPPSPEDEPPDSAKSKPNEKNTGKVKPSEGKPSDKLEATKQEGRPSREGPFPSSPRFKKTSRYYNTVVPRDRAARPATQGELAKAAVQARQASRQRRLGKDQPPSR